MVSLQDLFESSELIDGLYQEILIGGVKVRKFSKLTEISSLVWHTDESDRYISVLHSDGWLFQYDNELPFVLGKGDLFMVGEGTYHRVLSGDSDGDLIVGIFEG